MKAIVGTAGHIDHGKSALVRALTGIDPDRLPQERERGISIELGFAYLATPAGDRIGIVDVPGHERFVRQMLAGAQGFDYVLMVVAADDGVMPQTEEHFEICHLLGLERGAFVISKSDLATSARLDDVEAEIELLAEGTPLAGAPVFRTSATDGSGIDELRRHLVETLQTLERPAAEDVPFRLPVDRSFVLKGRGAVVTGTASDGMVRPGDELVVVATGAKARVREVQVHGTRVDAAGAGERVALNLSGVDATQVPRGTWVADPRAATATMRFEARVEVRPAARRALRSYEKVRVHLGTSDSLARIVWLGPAAEVAPKESELARITLIDAAVVALPGDRFVLRDQTGQRTVGGGRVVLGRAPKRRRRDVETLDRLRSLESSETGAKVTAYLDLTPDIAVPIAEVARSLRLAETDVGEVAAADPGVVVVETGDGGRLLASGERHGRYLDALLGRVHDHHQGLPSAPGMEIETLRRDLRPVLDVRPFRALLDDLCGRGLLERRGGAVAEPGHAVHMCAAEEVLADSVLVELRTAGPMPPAVVELAERHGAEVATMQTVLAVLVERSLAVKVSSELFFSREAVDEVASKLRRYLEREEKIAPAGLRDLIGATRKYTIPLLDYFDRTGLTVRNGDYRRLR